MLRLSLDPLGVAQLKLANKAIKFTHTYPQNPPFFGGFCFVSINATILEAQINLKNYHHDRQSRISDR